jgi:hypothetical protein
MLEEANTSLETDLSSKRPTRRHWDAVVSDPHRLVSSIHFNFFGSHLSHELFLLWTQTHIMPSESHFSHGGTWNAFIVLPCEHFWSSRKHLAHFFRFISFSGSQLQSCASPSLSQSLHITRVTNGFALILGWSAPVY